MDNSTNFDSTYPLVSDLTIHPFKNWGQTGKNPLEIVSNCFDFLLAIVIVVIFPLFLPVNNPGKYGRLQHLRGLC